MSANGTRMSKEVILIKQGEKVTLNAGYLLVKPYEAEKVVGGLLVTNPTGPRKGTIIAAGPKLPMQGTYNLRDDCWFNANASTPLEFSGNTFFIVPFSAILVAVHVPGRGRPKYENPEENGVMMLQNTDEYKRKMAFYSKSEIAIKEKQRRLELKNETKQ
mgnify:CR=1 FL=1